RVPGGPAVDLATPANPDAAWFMEWSNSLSRVFAKAGTKVPCVFTAEPSVIERRPDWPHTQTVELELRQMFEPDTAVIARELAAPGELTQTLCSPWQHDYRECACFYWAATRPDFVEVEVGADGKSAGFNWMDRRLDPTAPIAAREYLPDPWPDTPTDPVWLTYDELYQQWEELLRFIVGRKVGDQPP